MKKRFMAALSVLALALALPMAAFAAPSPANTTVTGANNVTASVNNPSVKVESTTKIAEGTPANANVVASFEITESQAGIVSESNPLTVTFTLGNEYAGAKVTVYVQHNDGEKETLNLTADNNGNVTFKVTKLSTYTIVAEKTAAGAATTDNGAKSPATGVNTTAVAAVAAVAAAGAACAFVALRKNN